MPIESTGAEATDHVVTIQAHLEDIKGTVEAIRHLIEDMGIVAFKAAYPAALEPLREMIESIDQLDKTAEYIRVLYRTL